MAKTVPPGMVSVPSGGNFVADAMPDPFDERDLEYRPRLEPLPPVLDQRAEQIVLTQTGNSCTGHAVASLINTVLARQILDTVPPFAPASAARSGSAGSLKDISGDVQPALPDVRPPGISLPKVSPYMLYRLARRYDEFEGEADAGSSLRGVFKGWFQHGVALSDDWPYLDMHTEPDLDDPRFMDKCRDRPLGAFYRVNPYRLDDMQSAISELNAIAVSSVIHDGWREPVEMTRNGESIHVIARQVNAQILGGHAFALVGYNEVGFLVQNSWGDNWGKGGFATLPYEDWLDCAYDAWAARPGVPKTPFASGRNRAALATGGTLATAPGPDLQRLAMHVINLGNEGRLSTTGKFASTPRQIERAFEHMGCWHDCWLQEQPESKREIVLYAHGGLVSETDGLATAQKHLNWWLNNRVYPLYVAWQSGPVETLVDQLGDLTQAHLPFGGLGFDLTEQFDRLVEKIARSSVRWMWDQMKENAHAASTPLSDSSLIQWPPVSSATQDAMLALPGASLTVTRLQRYLEDVGAEKVRVHLVGHSAGAIFLAALLPRLAEAEIAVESLALLAPAIRVDEWTSVMLPLLQAGQVHRFSTFAMTDQRELDDTVGTERLTPYHKSLLYLVSRALERPEPGQQGEVPLLGMARFFDLSLNGSGATLRQTIAALGDAEMVFSRADTPDDARSDAASHGDFDDDAPTMTSVVMRALGVQDASQVQGYQPHAALRAFDCAPQLDEDIEYLPDSAPLDAPTSPSLRMAAGGGAMSASPSLQSNEAGQLLDVAAGTHPPGEEPLAETAEPQTGRPVAPRTDGSRPSVEVAIAPHSGSAIVDLLQYAGWKREPRRGRNYPDRNYPDRNYPGIQKGLKGVVMNDEVKKLRDALHRIAELASSAADGWNGGSSANGDNKDAELIVCTPKSLPNEKVIEAAQRAREINPTNHPPMERMMALMAPARPLPMSIALMTGKRWSNKGVHLSVGFLDNPPADLRSRILLHMNAWGQSANVSFVQSNHSPEVRIARAGGQGGGYWSYVGTDILSIAGGEPTMNLEGFTMQTPESEFHRVVRHETGHTLGFPHEHMRRELVDRIDREKAIQYFGETQGWSSEEVVQQVLTPLEEAQILATPHADPNSIMCYQIPGFLTKDGQPITGGLDIDTSDFEFASEIYPKNLHTQRVLPDQGKNAY